MISLLEYNPQNNANPRNNAITRKKKCSITLSYLTFRSIFGDLDKNRN